MRIGLNRRSKPFRSRLCESETLLVALIKHLIRDSSVLNLTHLTSNQIFSCVPDTKFEPAFMELIILACDIVMKLFYS